MKLRQAIDSILALCLVALHDERGGFWLWKTFKSARDFANATSGSEVFNLPKQGIISNLVLEIYALSGNVKMDTYLQDAITKIEIIGNGSTVIQSLTGKQVQASQAWDDHQLSNDKEYSPSGGCWGYFDIRFGRWVGDQLYALDCSKWDSLEIKITYDLAAGQTIGTTGYTTSTGTLTLYGLYSPDGSGMSPIGYLKKSQKITYASSGGNSEDLALPTDYPFRRLLLLDTTHYLPPYNGFDYVTLNVNNGARKPIDNMRGNDIMQMDLAIRGYPVWYHGFRALLTSGQNAVHPRLGWVKSASIFKVGAVVTGANMGVQTVTIAAASTNSAHVDVWGYCPDKSLCIDFEKWSGGKHGIEAMMDCLGYDQKNDIHLLHTQAQTMALQVVLEQYATHPG